MKNLVLALAALMGPFLPLQPAMAAGAPSYFPPTYVSEVRVTAPGAGNALYAFQNTDSGVDVVVRKIEISNASTMTVSGGLMSFWVYGSTQMTHSAAVTSAYSYSAALTSQPSYVSVSTAPRSVLHEGDSAAPVGGAAGAPPLVRPLYLNDDEAATTLLSDSWSEESAGAAGPLVLLHNTSRGIVIWQKQLGASDFSAGSVLIRVFYTVR